MSGFQCVLPVKSPEIIDKYRPLLTSYRSMWSNGSWACVCGIRVVTVAETHHLWEKKGICSISSRSRVPAHRPCPKLEMFCPSVLQLFTAAAKFWWPITAWVFFFKLAGDPTSATLVSDLANQVWPFKRALFKTSRPGKRSWLTGEASATERHGNDRLSKRAVHTIR